MYNRKKNGFTLIELLAVILILGILALIAIPTIGNIILEAKKGAFKATATSISKAGENKCSNLSLTSKFDKLNVSFKDNVEVSEDMLTDYFKGKIPDKGQVSVSNECNTSLALWNEDLKMCAYKGYSDDKVILISMEDSHNCKLKEDGALDTDYVDTSSTGYKCSNPGSTIPTEEKYFTFNQNTGTLTGYSSEGPQDVVIPCKIGGVNVTTIGYSAFAGKELTSVVMPDTIKDILNSAFYNNKINKLEIGSSVEYIGSAAFRLNSITTLVIPDSVKSMADGGNSCTISSCPYGVFTGNPIQKITFGSGIENIGVYAFYQISTLTNVDFTRSINLKNISSGAFYGDGITELTLNSDNVVINDFSNNKITSLTITGDNVTINSGAFANNLIEKIKLNGRIVCIGKDAFKNNQLPPDEAYIYGKNSDGSDNTTLVSYGGASRDSIILPDNIKTITASFSGLGLTGTFDSGDGLTTINYGMFMSNTLTDVIIGDSVTSIYGSAFKNNKIKNLSFGKSLETIDSAAFYYNSIVSVVFPDSLKTINGCNYETCSIFGYNPLESVTFGSGLETIGPSAFYNIKSLTSVDFSRSINLVSIGAAAFSNGKITNLDLSNSTKLTTIDSSAFSSNNIISLDLSNNKNLNLLGVSAFSDNKITSLIITGDNVTINSRAFASNLIEEIELNGKVVSIGVDAFYNNQLPDSQAYIYGKNSDGSDNATLVSYGGASRDSIILPDNIKTITASFSGLGLTGTFDSGDGLTTINYGMFMSNTLTDVIIGNSVTSIEIFAFKDNKIKNLTFGNSLETINEGAFYNNSIVSVVFPDSLKTINGCNYETCSIFGYNPLESVTFGSGLETIGPSAFYNIKSLTSVDFSRSTNLTKIDEAAFYMGGITNVDLSNSKNLNFLGRLAFSNNKITNLKLYGNELNIYNNVFASNLIEEMELNGKVVSIGVDAFYNNQLPDSQAYIYGKNSDGSDNTTLVSYGGASRNNIVIPDNITMVTASFSGLGLTGTFDSGDGLIDIKSSMLANNTLTKIILGDSIKSLQPYAFYGNQISEVDFGNNIETIDYAAFTNNKLKTLVFPDSLKEIKDYSEDVTYTVGAFYGNPLTSVKFGTGIQKIGAASFYNITTLTDVDFSKAINLTSIRGASFYGTGIADVDLSNCNSLGSINKLSFYNTKLASIEIPSSVTTIGTSAFGNVSTLQKIFVHGKVDATNFTSLGASWNGICTNIIYELSSCYTYSGNTITDYNSVCSKAIEIPSSINGNAITTLADNAFSNKGLTRVLIPSSITTIGNNVFSNNSIEPIIVLGKSSSSDFTYAGTNWDGNNKIIYENNPMTCLKINDGELSGRYNDSFCANYVDISIPSSVTSIKENTFKGLLLDSITVLDKTRLASIGANWNGTVYKVNFEGDSYEYNCFTLDGTKITQYKNYCSASVDLTKTIQGKSITEIANSAFNNVAINNLILSSNITSIGEFAFANNDIEELTMVDGLTTIGSSAFSNSGLTNVVIPSTVTTIGQSAFANNDKLESITILGKTDASKFSSLGSSWNGICNNIIYSN